MSGLKFKDQFKDHDMMKVQQLGARRGWNWIRGGYGLFEKSPVIWIALFLIYLLIGVLLSMVPIFGPIVLNLLAPVFMAGFMLGCRALENGEELEINHLFAGFRHNTSQLVTVGGLYLAGIIVIVGIFTLLAKGVSNPMEVVAEGEQKSGIIIAGLVALAMMLPLVMAYWFAPVLVVLHDVRAVAAMKLSFVACLRNILPFVLYSLISMALMLLAILPLGLGLLVMIPTMTASLYASYQEIFCERAAVEEPALLR